MKLDEFAFMNQQLAAMLRDGIPLEGALRRLSEEMRQGALKSELQMLEADLAKGIPLREAIRARQLPELYRQMLEVGVQSNDLPAVLTLLADHYQRRHTIWTRLKGLMVYPLIVLVAALALSCFLSIVLKALVWPNLAALTDFAGRGSAGAAASGLWLPPAVLGLTVAAAFLGMTVPFVRRALRWRLPAFKEASLAQVASSMSLMLRSGVPIGDALALVARLEDRTRAGKELSQWRQRLAAGQGKFAEMATSGKAFPPLFIWMVAHAGEDLASGFQRAAEIFQGSAAYRAELLLYSALPCSVLALGLMIVCQIRPMLASLIAFMNLIGNVGGGGN
jgi:type II secretory pathway component PulF